MMRKKQKIFIIITSIIFIIFGLTYIIYPKINLEKSTIDLNINDEYKEVSYSAKNFFQDLTNKVKVEGNVDTSKVGEYDITYELNYGIFNVKKVLKINVKDIEKPNLNLIGDQEYKVCSLSSFVEPGFTAIDNYDGDVTSKVIKRYIDESNIEYSVKDSSNNMVTANRRLIVSDDVKPTITLNGDEKITLNIGDNYEEKGATASDNCDGNLTKSIEIQGSVDTSKVGEYKITYYVKDSNNNEEKKERIVIVKEKEEVKENNSEEENNDGIIYLTFDDGPGSYTDKILDILNQNDVKATFFVTLAGSDETLKREANEGHTVALHTATHNYNIYNSVESYFEDLNRVSKRVKDVVGIDSKYIRFPGGSSNTVSKGHKKGIMKTLAKEVQDRGYKYFDWNVDVNDAGSCVGARDKSGCVLNNFKKGLHPNRYNVVLMHDIKSYTADALDEMIKYGKEKNYTFKVIDDETPTCHHGINN